MVCKEDVVLWFIELSGHKRIDVMCTLLNKCLPTELRFFGTCLEDLGKQHFNHMKDFEMKANNPAELSELLVQCIISDTRTRQKLVLYICLIHSLNTTCSTNLYKALSMLDVNQIVPVSKSADKKLLEELLLIYTVAVNHPAFTFEQKATLGNILLSLREKEEQLQAPKFPEGLTEDYVNSALNLGSSECGDVPPANTPNCPELHPRSIPPGLNYPGALGSAGNYIPIPTYPPFPMQQHPPILWQVVNIPSLPAEAMAVPEMGPPVAGAPVNFPSSPHISRQSSPSQSASPSRTTSPVRKTYHHKVERSNSQSRSNSKPNYPEYPYQNPAVVNVNITKKNCLDRFEAKDVSMKSEDEMRGLIDRKPDLGTDEIHQLRTTVVNGITDPDHRDFPHFMAKQKGYESEVSHSNVPIIPRPIEANVMSNQPPSIVPLKPCCPSGTGPRYNPQVYCPHNLQALNLDNDGSRHCSSSSSNSDASSTSHSPPATPGNPNQNWEKGGAEKPQRVQETSDGGSEDVGGMSTAAVAATAVAAGTTAAAAAASTTSAATGTAASAPLPKSERSRILAGRGRGRLGNPLGIQTLPRGRGPHSNIVVDNSLKSLSISRKDGPRSAPPTPHDDKKGYVVPSAEAPQSSSTMALPLPSSGKPPNHDMVASGVPYSTTFLPTQFTGPPMFHTYHGAFVRPFHFHNGDLQMYPYQPQPPFVPPPVVTYSSTILPPKTACSNCGSQSHHASECKEPTMEEYTSKGQYRIDYKPYNNNNNNNNKQGECLSEK